MTVIYPMGEPALVTDVTDLQPQEYQWIEYFAGRARATLAMRAAGYRCARLDISYFPEELNLGNNYFDILSPSGFACISQ